MRSNFHDSFTRGRPRESWKRSVAYRVVQCGRSHTSRSTYQLMSSSSVAPTASDHTKKPCFRTDSQVPASYSRPRTWHNKSAQCWRHNSHDVLSVSSRWRHDHRTHNLSITHQLTIIQTPPYPLSSETYNVGWRGSLVVSALDQRLRGRGFESSWPRAVA